jgi:hypothetical protein
MDKIPQNPQRIANIVNKDNRAKRVVYLGSAWDIGSCILHTGAAEYVFIDQIDRDYGKYACFNGKDNTPKRTMKLLKGELRELGYNIKKESWTKKDTYTLCRIFCDDLALWYYFYVDYFDISTMESLPQLKGIDIWYSKGVLLPIDQQIPKDKQSAWLKMMQTVSNENAFIMFFYPNLDSEDGSELSIDDIYPYIILINNFRCIETIEESWYNHTDDFFEELFVKIFQMS